MNKFNAQYLLVSLAQRIRQKVYPSLGATKAREVQGVAHSGNVTFQLDAYIDITGRMVDDVDDNTHLLQIANQKQIMGLFAYDIAEAYLIAKESHCIITDAWGNTLDNVSLIYKNILSCVVASNLALHRKLINWLNQ